MFESFSASEMEVGHSLCPASLRILFFDRQMGKHVLKAPKRRCSEVHMKYTKKMHRSNQGKEQKDSFPASLRMLRTGLFGCL